MAQIDWRFEAVELLTCNCDWGCPCQFNARPTHGDCRAAGAFSRDSPDGLGCMARMCLLGASGNRRSPVNATNGAPQRFLGKANSLRAWFGTYLWDRRRTSPMALLLTLAATLMSGAALA